MNELINQSMSEEGDVTTAPTTPGLLITTLNKTNVVSSNINNTDNLFQSSLN